MERRLLYEENIKEDILKVAVFERHQGTGNHAVGFVKDLGCILESPFLQLALIALPVIPELKITDKGVVEV